MSIKYKALLTLVSLFSLTYSVHAADIVLEDKIIGYPTIVEKDEVFELSFTSTNTSQSEILVDDCIVGSNFSNGESQEIPPIQGVDFTISAPSGQNYEGTRDGIYLSINNYTPEYEYINLFHQIKLKPSEGMTITETVNLSDQVNVGDSINLTFRCPAEGDLTVNPFSESEEILVIEQYPFSDIRESVFKGYIYNLKQDAIINGYSDGTYRPNESVTRAQMANYIVKAFGFNQNSSGATFPDVTDMTNDTNRNIQTLKNLGIVGGYSDGAYRPNNNLTRAELTKYIYIALEKKGKDVDPDRSEPFADVSDSSNFRDYIAFLVTTEVESETIIKGYSDGLYHPDELINRGAMAKVIDLARKY